MFAFLSGASPASTTQTVDDVMLYITAISVVLLIGITATMIFFVFKYNRKKGHKPKDIHGNIWLEILWIGIPTILVLTMFYYGYLGFNQIRNIPDDAFNIDVNARMWAWEFNYPNGVKSDTLYIPVDKPIKLSMTSMDVNHSLYIPAFRIKEDVIAGRNNYLSFTADEVGDYVIECAEYCGLKHSMMFSAVIAMKQSEFDKWYNQGQEDSTNTSAEEIKDTSNVGGEPTAQLEIPFHKLLQEKGCMNCHTLDGSEKLAPSFKGIAGTKQIVLTDGKEREIVVDDDYLRRSIISPNADIVKGYAMGMMPSQKYNLSEDELDKVIESIKSIN